MELSTFSVYLLLNVHTCLFLGVTEQVAPGAKYTAELSAMGVTLREQNCGQAKLVLTRGELKPLDVLGIYSGKMHLAGSAPESFLDFTPQLLPRGRRQPRRRRRGGARFSA